MADVTVVKDSYRWTFDLVRDDETTTRTISMDNAKTDEAGLSAAKAFRDMFSGSISSPLTIIDPQTFIQPSGWRDNNPHESPWTTKSCELARVKETTTYYENPQPTPSVEAHFEFYPDEEILYVYRPGTGKVSLYSESGGNLTTIAATTSDTQEDAVGYSFNPNVATNYVAQIAAQGDYGATIIAKRYPE